MLFGKKETINMKIEGMHCEHCAAKVIDAVKQLGAKADVDLKLGRAAVSAPKGLDPQTIADAINALGFKASVI